MSQQRRGPPPTELFAFPTMDSREILDCLYALGISVQPEDLAKPSAASAQMIFAELLEALMAINIGDAAVEGPKGTLMGMMEYKELYGDSLSFSMFFKHCRDLANLCGISNFAMADLTRPEATRLRTVLSGIMNFAKFRDERAAFHLVLQQKVAAQGERTIKLRKQLEKLEHDIDAITAKHQADRPRQEELQARNDSHKSDLLAMREQQGKLSAEHEALKRTKEGIAERGAAIQAEHARVTLQKGQTSSRLVQSPDRIKRNISTMHDMVQSEKSELALFQRATREYSNRLDVIATLEMDLKGLIDLEKGIEHERNKVEEQRRNTLSLQARREVKEIESQNDSAKLEQLGRQLHYASDKLQRQLQMGKEMQQRAQAKLDSLKQEYMERSKERSVWQRKREVIQSQQKELEAEMAAFVSESEGEINELLGEYWTMRRQAEDYMNTMTDRLGLHLRA